MLQTGDVVPFAPHSPGWKHTEDRRGCYGVLDGRRVVASVADGQVDQFIELCEQSARKYLGGEVIFTNGGWAWDAVCGKVFIIYFARLPQEGGA